jgi:hypothetical protein
MAGKGHFASSVIDCRHGRAFDDTQKCGPKKSSRRLHGGSFPSGRNTGRMGGIGIEKLGGGMSRSEPKIPCE